jgi:hypothetical protein
MEYVYIDEVFSDANTFIKKLTSREIMKLKESAKEAWDFYQNSGEFPSVDMLKAFSSILFQLEMEYGRSVFSKYYENYVYTVTVAIFFILNGGNESCFDAPKGNCPILFPERADEYAEKYLEIKDSERKVFSEMGLVLNGIERGTIDESELEKIVTKRNNLVDQMEEIRVLLKNSILVITETNGKPRMYALPYPVDISHAKDYRKDL